MRERSLSFWTTFASQSSRVTRKTRYMKRFATVGMELGVILTSASLVISRYVSLDGFPR